MEIYDIAVIGAGPAGIMAAICGAIQGKNVILLERNDKIGRKLLLTGHGRCNITNAAKRKDFLDKFGKMSSFYSNVFNKFSNHDLIDFFKDNGLELKEEEEGRIFPVTGKSKSVVNLLKRLLDEYGVNVVYNYRLTHLKKQSEFFKLISTENILINANNVIIATGGVSCPFTGSTGDGFTIAQLLGHQITELRPGGIPLLVKEEWITELKGIIVDNVGFKIEYNDKLMPLSQGEVLFMSSSVSGPVILDMSNKIVQIMEKYGDLKLYLDFLPEIKKEVLENKFLNDLRNHSKINLRGYLENYLPQKAINPLLKIISLDPLKELNQFAEMDRLKLIDTLKSLSLTITGHLPLDKALVTCGGVLNTQIDSQTMESNIVPKLYFAGEIIDGCGRRGGYNLQQAFSTGYIAGISASK